MNLPKQSQLDLKPKPKVTKINRGAFYMVCGVIVVICCVLIYSVTKRTPVNSINNDVMPATSTQEIADQPRWYANVSDALPSTATQSDENVQLESNEGMIKKDELKKNQEALKAAYDSPIKVPNIGESTTSNVQPSGEKMLDPINNVTSNIPSTANTQDEKIGFLKQLMQKHDPDYLHEIVKKPLSPFEVKSGTVIPAVLAGGINSDLPGQLTALVSKNVFDSVSGRYLLIPQGSKLILQYDSHVAYGQERLLVAVKRLIFPNGSSLDLDGMPASDASGYAGLYDEVSNHYGRIFGSSAIMGLITGGFQLSQPHENSGNDASAAAVMGGALGQQMGQVAMGMMGKNLDIQSTLTIRPGYEFNVTVTADLVFPGSYRY